MTRDRRLWVGAAGAAALLALPGVLAGWSGAGTAVAAGATRTGHHRTAPQEAGTPGYCPNGRGVTVVVDFQQLGGGVVVRCAPGPLGKNFNGIDALESAGFPPTGTQRWGLDLVCRIAGIPSVSQDIPIQGDRHYHEKCVNTPPTAAYWSYWHARNGGSWVYSEQGPETSDVTRGGFEGWSFSLNHAEGDAPPPRIAPKRPPAHQPPTKSPPPTTPHRTPTQPTRHSTGSASGAGSRPSNPAKSSHTALSPTTPDTTQQPMGRSSGPTGSATITATANPVAEGHNRNGVPVSGSLPGGGSAGGGSHPLSLVIGLLIVALLAVGGFAAWRRRKAVP